MSLVWGLWPYLDQKLSLCIDTLSRIALFILLLIHNTELQKETSALPATVLYYTQHNIKHAIYIIDVN